MAVTKTEFVVSRRQPKMWLDVQTARKYLRARVLPSELCESDFKHLTELGITVGGSPSAAQQRTCSKAASRSASVSRRLNSINFRSEMSLKYTVSPLSWAGVEFKPSVR
jgi:hypothetical protein